MSSYSRTLQRQARRINSVKRSQFDASTSIDLAASFKSFISKKRSTATELVVSIGAGIAASSAIKAAFTGAAVAVFGTTLSVSTVALGAAAVAGVGVAVGREYLSRYRGNAKKNMVGVIALGLGGGLIGGAAVEHFGPIAKEYIAQIDLSQVKSVVVSSLSNAAEQFRTLAAQLPRPEMPSFVSNAASSVFGFGKNMFGKMLSSFTSTTPELAALSPEPQLDPINMIQVNDITTTDEPYSKFINPEATCDDPDLNRPYIDQLADTFADQKPGCEDKDFLAQHLDPPNFAPAPGLFGNLLTPELYARLPNVLQETAAKAVKSGNPLSLCKVIKEISFALTQEGLGPEAMQKSAELVREGATLVFNNDLLDTTVGKQLNADVAYNTLKGHYPDVPVAERMKRALFHTLLAGDKHSTFTKYLVAIAEQKNPALLADVRTAVASLHENLGTMKALRPQLSQMMSGAGQQVAMAH